jgi:hypothetical protein
MPPQQGVHQVSHITSNEEQYTDLVKSSVDDLRLDQEQPTPKRIGMVVVVEQKGLDQIDNLSALSEEQRQEAERAVVVVLLKGRMTSDNSLSYSESTNGESQEHYLQTDDDDEITMPGRQEQAAIILQGMIRMIIAKKLLVCLHEQKRLCMVVVVEQKGLDQIDNLSALTEEQRQEAERAVVVVLLKGRMTSDDSFSYGKPTNGESQQHDDDESTMSGRQEQAVIVLQGMIRMIIAKKLLVCLQEQKRLFNLSLLSHKQSLLLPARTVEHKENSYKQPDDDTSHQTLETEQQETLEEAEPPLHDTDQKYTAKAGPEIGGKDAYDMTLELALSIRNQILSVWKFIQSGVRESMSDVQGKFHAIDRVLLRRIICLCTFAALFLVLHQTTNYVFPFFVRRLRIKV